jgi:AAA domain/RNase_H superfamily
VGHETGGREAVQDFIEMVTERRRLYPDMHVYHYGAYEETAIKRMAGQHSTCVDEVDELLRGEVLVDMFRAVRQGLRASVESYSIKKLETFYEYKRDVNLPEANLALQTFQTLLAFGPGEENLDDIKTAIEGYNRDDCVSALRLRDWLERLRTELEEQIGAPLPRPGPKEDEPSENLTEYLHRVSAVEQQLTAGLPEDKETRTEAQKATALLADLLLWHRREDKSKYWEYFNRCDFSDEEFVTDRATLGGLVYEGEIEKVKNSTIHRYRFPFQDTTIERAKKIRDPKTRVTPGDLHAIDYEALTIDLKRGPKLADAPHPTALVPYDIFNVEVLRESLLRLGGWVADHGSEGDGKARIVAGTVWLWARPEMAGSVDVLFVDEAGQMSLANVLAASSATGSIVLLGDPQQLDQPQRGVHPDGAEASALSHLLNEHKTITPDRGLFLAESWRLHADICAFTSDVFYESRLTSRPENANQRLNVAGPIAGTGLRFVPVEHQANQSDSPEEVEKVAEVVELLLRDDVTWVDKESKVRRISLDDILIVAPYNAQVSLLLRSLPRGARVGTVDKFQGQEAPVVIYSMATSTPQDAPRGMEFLYSGNRLNVATSRAQCVTVLVASPALFDVQCKTPRQMELANAFCRYLEMAEVV